MRRPSDPRKAAEAFFKPVGAAAEKAPAPERKPLIPGSRETVSLRIDREVLEKFQADGPGWQDRINTALRKAAGL